MGPTLDYATPAEADPEETVWPWRITWPLLLFCLYAPYAWILFVDYRWNDYRLFWLAAWPVLPGLVVGLFVRGSTPVTMAAMGAFTGAVVYATWLIVRLGRRRRWIVIAVATVVLALSILNAWFAYLVFRS